jgi:hypothetical protein
MTEENSVELVVSIEAPPLKVSVAKKCSLNEVSKNVETILDELAKSKEKLPKWAEAKIALSLEKPSTAAPLTEDPLERVARRLEVDLDDLAKAKLFGIKGGKVQVFKTQRFSAADAVMAICFLSEIGLGKTVMSFDELKEAFLESHIRSGSPLYMIISNVGNRGYIDKQRYDSQKEVVLTAKGETKIKEIIQEALSRKEGQK